MEKTAARLKRRGDNRCPILLIPEVHILGVVEKLGLSFTHFVVKIKIGQLERLHFQKRSSGERKRHFLQREDFFSFNPPLSSLLSSKHDAVKEKPSPLNKQETTLDKISVPSLSCVRQAGSPLPQNTPEPAGSGALGRGCGAPRGETACPRFTEPAPASRWKSTSAPRASPKFSFR